MYVLIRISFKNFNISLVKSYNPHETFEGCVMKNLKGELYNLSTKLFTQLHMLINLDERPKLTSCNQVKT